MQNKNYLHGFIMLCLGWLLFACSKDHDEAIPIVEEAFENPGDFVTTRVQTSIPRIQYKNNKLTCFLSVTNQEDEPLEHFTRGNFEMEVFLGCDGDCDDSGGNGDDECGELLDVLMSSVKVKVVYEDENKLPVASATTLDYSNSMSSIDIWAMERAVRTYIDLKEEEDRVSIVKFATKVEEMQGFTEEPSLLLTAIDRDPTADLGTRTSFFDACQLALEDTEDQEGFFPVVIGFSDGKDNESVTELSDLIEEAQIVQVPFYTVGFGFADVHTLRRLAAETGGRYAYTPNRNALEALYSSISRQIKKTYILEWETDLPKNAMICLRVKTKYSCGNGDLEDKNARVVKLK